MGLIVQIYSSEPSEAVPAIEINRNGGVKLDWVERTISGGMELVRVSYSTAWTQMGNVG